MRIFAAGLLLCLCCSPTREVAAQTMAAETVADPMAPISWLAGDWHSSLPDPVNPKRLSKIESRYRLTLGGKLLTFSMAMAGHDVMQGMFAYDGVKKGITFWYVIADPEESEADGTVAEGS